MSRPLTKKEIEQLTKIRETPAYKITIYIIYTVLIMLGIFINAICVWIVFKILGVL